MSLLHSFYCWGHVFVVLASTAFFLSVGIENWRALACVWAAVPLLNALYFARVPIASLVEEGEGMTLRSLFREKTFWVLGLLMVCAGASEQGMSQWASAFAEGALGVSKTVGDLAGPLSFALCMGTARALYAAFSERISLRLFMAGSAVLCILSYLGASLTQNALLGLASCALCGLSVGILWPGTFSMAAKALRRGGTALFALLALAGDLGCSAGPAVVGVVSAAMGANLRMGLLAAVVFPVALLLSLAALRSNRT